MARILGIDAGDVRTGVALSDPGEFMASGLCTLTEYSEERLIDRLCALIALHNAEKVVLGLPVNMDGTKPKKWRLLPQNCRKPAGKK